MRIRNRQALRLGVQPSQFDLWVSENGVPDTFEYRKGWCDYVEFIQRFAWMLETDIVRVVGHYFVDTPPPCERLPMPAVAIEAKGITFALRFDFGSLWARHDLNSWVVSVKRRSPYTGPLFGLIDETGDLGEFDIDGIPPALFFGSYRANPAQFTCLVRDEWEVATLMRILAHEP